MVEVSFSFALVNKLRCSCRGCRHRIFHFLLDHPIYYIFNIMAMLICAHCTLFKVWISCRAGPHFFRFFWLWLLCYSIVEFLTAEVIGGDCTDHLSLFLQLLLHIESRATGDSQLLKQESKCLDISSFCWSQILVKCFAVHVCWVHYIYACYGYATCLVRGLLPVVLESDWSGRRTRRVGTYGQTRRTMNIIKWSGM